MAVNEPDQTAPPPSSYRRWDAYDALRKRKEPRRELNRRQAVNLARALAEGDASADEVRQAMGREGYLSQ